MKETSVKRLAQVLRVLVTVTFLCNLAVLPLVPGLVFTGSAMRGEILAGLLTGAKGSKVFLLAWSAVWGSQYTGMLTLFLLFCGVCTAAILWQARRVLGSVIARETFTMDNARNMRTAAVGCFFISFAAAVRMIWGFFYYRSPRPLFTYNALFIPIFLMGGLLCMVMSALFRQAAEMKAENDLTI